MLRTKTRGGRMVGTDKSTELWRDYAKFIGSFGVLQIVKTYTTNF